MYTFKNEYIRNKFVKCSTATVCGASITSPSTWSYVVYLGKEIGKGGESLASNVKPMASKNKTKERDDENSLVPPFIA